MKAIDKKTYIKKLIRDELNEVEQTELLQSAPVTKKMHQQWMEAPDRVKSDKVDGRRIWKNICKESWSRIPARKARFYRLYSRVATLLLLLGLSGMAFMWIHQTTTPPVFVVTAGIQNIETIMLPDGTAVQLGPGSRLTYPSEFTGKRREIGLDGQAFFDVRKDTSRPFIVSTSCMQIEALGTAFEIFSYEHENRSEAILLNGKIKVNVTPPGSTKQTEIVLLPNDKIEYNNRENRLIPSTVDADTYTSWRKRGVLTFENEKLSMIIPRLEQWYGRKIMCEKEIAETYKFTFKVRDESLERILYMMRASSPVRYSQLEDGDFMLYLKK